MESFEVLEKAIPRKESKRVAQLLGVSPDYVRRWRREPESDDAPNGSGQRSILDRVCDLLDAVYLVNPGGCALIVEHIKAHYRKLVKAHAQPIDSHQDRAEHCADLLRETVEAANKLNLDGCTQETLTELIQMRDVADRAIIAVEQTLSAKEE